MGNPNDITAGSVTLSTQDGKAFIEQASPLTRLHYFDGKFLKADALAQEQSYHRTQVRLANLAGGWGVVHGLGIELAGDQLSVGAGLAVTPAGHFVLAVGEVQAALTELLKVAVPTPQAVGNAEFGHCTGQATGGVNETAALGLYEITVGPVEGLCGNEPVYGALCETACVSDSRHPYWREGLVLRLRPIVLNLPTSTAVPFSAKHLRSRVASAYFAAEPGATPPALSASGLMSGVWCQPASLYGRDEVVIGLLVREAGVNRVIDAWAGRRERMEAQARGYWQGRMAMRPWNVYLAQILQFQCQLSGVLGQGGGVETEPDDCDQVRATLDKTRVEIEALHKKYAESAKKIVEALGGKASKTEAQQLADEVQSAYAQLHELSAQLSGTEAGQGALPKHRLLINHGFVQLPPAGYLPVQPGKTPLPEQLARIFGEGVRLHYRAARADVLPHLLEQAQHMARISLTQGLDDPQALEDVEIFVPDGQVIDLATQSPGRWWDLSASARAVAVDALPVESVGLKRATLSQGHAAGQPPQPDLDGLARTEARPDGTLALTLALSRMAADGGGDGHGDGGEDGGTATAGTHGQAGGQDDRAIGAGLAAYVGADLATDPFGLEVGDETQGSIELRMSLSKPEMRVVYDARFTGSVIVQQRKSLPQGRAMLVVEFDASSSVMVRINGQAQSKSGRNPIRLGLVREGDGQTGVLMLDDPAFDTASPFVQLDWEGAPTLATLSMVAQARGGQQQPVAAQQLFSLMRFKDKEDSKAAEAQPAEAAAAAVGNDDQQTAAGAATTRVDLATARALPEAPAAGSSLGALALNVLVTLSDASDDPAFLVRARRRLFPALEAAGRQDVRAVRDWVMFRRLRPTFCPPACAPAPRPGVEAFQLWHLRAKSAEQVAAVQAALDQGDDETLGGMGFKPVGVLRFADDSTQPEESPSAVRAMWQQAQPGARVALGRAWETRPTAGQGWQNHFRLRAMLDQIASLTQPPAPGDGTVTTLPQAPGPLAGGGLDGGMLVVTLDAGQALVTPHRVLFMPAGLWADLEPTFKRSAASGWKSLEEMLQSQERPIVDITLQVKDNALSATDEKALREAEQALRDKLGSSNPFRHDAVRLEAKKMSPGELPEVQHKAVAQVFNAGARGVYALKSVADLGGGAHVMSVIVVDEITPQ